MFYYVLDNSAGLYMDSPPYHTSLEVIQKLSLIPFEKAAGFYVRPLEIQLQLLLIVKLS